MPGMQARTAALAVFTLTRPSMIAPRGRRDLGFDLGKFLGGHAAAQIEFEQTAG